MQIFNVESHEEQDGTQKQFDEDTQVMGHFMPRSSQKPRKVKKLGLYNIDKTYISITL